jgi:PII-like signaling protein
MKLEGDGKLLRIFLGESDKVNGRMMYEAIVRAARESGLAGATVLRGVEGFGARSRIHTAKILRLSEDLPVIVEIVDTEEKIMAFMPMVDELFSKSGGGGLMTLEKAQVIHYTPGGASPGTKA